jgi:hypothetical protein
MAVPTLKIIFVCRRHFAVLPDFTCFWYKDRAQRLSKNRLRHQVEVQQTIFVATEIAPAASAAPTISQRLVNCSGLLLHPRIHTCQGLDF